MANLPSNTFLVNYNARDYNPTTKTLPKTSGQLFDEDIVFSGTPYAYDGECIDFSGNTNAVFCKEWMTTSWNPFNRSSADTTFTAIYKTADFISDSENLIANRDGLKYNYMIRGNMFHTQVSGYLDFTPSGNPQYIIIRVNSDGSAERKEVDSNGNTIQSVSASTIEWGTNTWGVGFFNKNSNSLGEQFKGKFYWMYISNEALTDSEIRQVIQYNEGGSLSLSTDNLTYSASGGSQTVTVTSEENNWSASTQDSWITISPATGATGDTTVTITVKQALSSKTGSVTFTDGNSTVELTVSQINDNIPINKIFYNGTKI